MNMPNFLIIGASKAGTTALYEYLKQHPQIYMSPMKELRFFAIEGQNLNFCGPWDQVEIDRYSIKTLEAYQQQFQDVSDEIAIGEASPWYLYSEQACQRIKYHIPNVKLIAILRDPVERAYSHFSMHVLQGREPLNDFTQAIEQEEIRIQNNWGWAWHYINRGLYYGQLKRYFNTFDQSQIKVYLYRDLKNNPVALLQDIFQFLDVDASLIPDFSVKHNVSGTPKNKTLHSFLTHKNPIKTLLKPLIPSRVRQKISTHIKNQNLVKSKVPTEVRQKLIKEVYQEDILKLQDLIKRDLSHWLSE
ncbi:MAG: sulfotransferase [Limnoraphis robusta]|jgi:hypothetical protein